MSGSPQRVKGPRWLQVPLVNLPFISIQLVWSTSAAFVSLYLLELGLSRAHMALVMIAGPLSGLVVQPTVGALADRSTSRWGRRRPYMLAGSLIAAMSLIMLSRAQKLAAWLAGSTSQYHVGLAQAIAIIAVYLIDFAINMVMVAVRTLTMDVLPTELQSASGVWASCMTGIGGILAFYAGTMPLDKLFPALGNSQVAVLTAIAAISLIGTQIITSASVSEVVNTTEIDSKPTFSGVRSRGRVALLESFRSVPRDIKSICTIQFFSAMGWFPALFFGTVWMGDIYVHQMRQLKGPQAGSDETLRAEAAKAASNAMFCGAVVLLVTVVVLPHFVNNPELRPEDGSSRHGDIEPDNTSNTRRLDLVSCWMLTHGLLGILLLSSSFIDTIEGATIMYALIGIHSGVIHWVPYALVAIAAHKEPPQSLPRPASQQSTGNFNPELEALLEDSAELTISPAQKNVAGDIPNRIGWFIGLQNASMTLPMFICILMLAAIFAILEPGRTVVGGDPSESSSSKRGRSIDIVFSIGGLCSLVSCFLTRKLLE